MNADQEQLVMDLRAALTDVPVGQQREAIALGVRLAAAVLQRNIVTGSNADIAETSQPFMCEDGQTVALELTLTDGNCMVLTFNPDEARELGLAVPLCD